MPKKQKGMEKTGKAAFNTMNDLNDNEFSKELAVTKNKGKQATGKAAYNTNKDLNS